MVQLAWHDLEGARSYLLLIPRRAVSIRLFCVLPLLFAYATLRDLTRTPQALVRREVVKISRAEVKSLTLFGFLVILSNRGLGWLADRRDASRGGSSLRSRGRSLTLLSEAARLSALGFTAAASMLSSVGGRPASPRSSRSSTCSSASCARATVRVCAERAAPHTAGTSTAAGATTASTGKLSAASTPPATATRPRTRRSPGPSTRGGSQLRLEPNDDA